MPRDWCRINGTKAVTRMRSPYVVEQLAQLERQREQLSIDAASAWLEFLGDFSQHYDSYRTAVHALAQLDCLLALARLATEGGYAKPVICKRTAHLTSVHARDGGTVRAAAAVFRLCRSDQGAARRITHGPAHRSRPGALLACTADGEEPRVTIVNGRHPIVAALMTNGQYVPNSTAMMVRGLACMQSGGVAKRGGNGVWAGKGGGPDGGRNQRQGAPGSPQNRQACRRSVVLTRGRPFPS